MCRQQEVLVKKAHVLCPFEGVNAQMLSDIEKKGCEDILNRLSSEELISLKDTVTNKLIAVEGKREAIKVIISYTEDVQQLLRRKKVKRDLLFQYLYDNNVTVLPSAEKAALIHEILILWRSMPSKVQQEPEDINDESKTDVRVAAPEQRKPTSEGQKLAEHFVTWFYNMLNSHNPTCPSQAEDQFSHVHFFEDCRLKLVCDTTDSRFEEFGGAQLVCQRLLAFVQEELLIFNPNISPEGLRGLSEPHGLVVVMVCGTIHRQQTCLGIFEQSFGLVKDPHCENNWKIKYTNLKMLGTPVTQIPKLEQSSILPLPSTNLQ
ncbi:uncharacterized protein C3orf38 homolog [Lingula anatina]|uniref:Uncharacterized protein C3orf38 homolog n=1 Tax=Lingula anatina TaxID=7574 RepID=A0A1S3HV51_LINAN|nr:uncharacterized protein C3orf38 homolog [Lingula anatina]|eukprot:XP_013389920.1 uncharacterized protein C3orf38 homolog [Lingula anatina]